MLNLTVLADIMLGNVDKWNHQAIQELNPSLTLPNKNITVVTPLFDTNTMLLLTQVLSNVSTEFRNSVSPSSPVRRPARILT